MHPKWNKKITLDLNQLKATHKKIILHRKKKDNHRRPLFPDRPPFCFFLAFAYIFLMTVLLVGKKKTTELYSFTKREPVSLGKRRNQTHLG